MKSDSHAKEDYDPNTIYRVDEYGTRKFHKFIDYHIAEGFPPGTEHAIVRPQIEVIEEADALPAHDRRLSRRELVTKSLAGAALVVAAGTTSMGLHELGLFGDEEAPEPEIFTVPHDNPSLDSMREIVAYVYPEELNTEDKISAYIASGVIVNATAAENPERTNSYDTIWGGDTLLLPHP